MPDTQFLWWDGIHPLRTRHSLLIPQELKEDNDLFSVFESWISDNEHLQNQLDAFEATTLLVNDPQSKNQVFSHTAAVGVIDWIKVRSTARG